jgi:hypothetical protein
MLPFSHGVRRDRPDAIRSLEGENRDGLTRRGRSMRFLYLYLMRDVPDRVRAAAPEHAAYWRALG